MIFLVIGCGSIGRRHIRNLVALKAGTVIGVDPSPERRDEAARESGIATYADLATALQQRPDAVLVCNPTSMHMPAALEAAKAGAHLFIEKPLSHDVDGVAALQEQMNQTGKVVLVGCNFRFHEGLRAVKDWVDSGAIGRVLFSRIQYGQYLPDRHPWEDYRVGYAASKNLGGGIILDAVHELDIAMWLMGDVDRVVCFADHLSQLEMDVEDTAEILLRFRNGAMAEVHMDLVQRVYNRSCEVVGEVGTIHWSYQDRQASLYSSESRTWTTLEWPHFDPNTMYVEQMRHFIRCIEGVEQPVLDAAGGKRVLEVALAAKESAQKLAVCAINVHR